MPLEIHIEHIGKEFGILENWVKHQCLLVSLLRCQLTKWNMLIYSVLFIDSAVLSWWKTNYRKWLCEMRGVSNKVCSLLCTSLGELREREREIAMIVDQRHLTYLLLFLDDMFSVSLAFCHASLPMYYCVHVLHVQSEL